MPEVFDQAPPARQAGPAEIRFEGVSKWYGGSRESGFLAVDAVDLEVRRGELVALLGKTGCGKSTLFNMIAGLQAPSAGTLRVQGHDPFRDFAALRGHISIVFQNDRLLPWRNALDNAAFGLEMMDVPKAERHAKARHWLARLGLHGHEADYPHALSGGMRQRVAIARAFATEAPIMLCDEPFSALDEITASRLRGEFSELVRETGRTAVFITHSIGEALEIGSRIVVLQRPARIAYEATMAGAGEAERTQIRARIRETLAL
ncbi:ABC transporter ATP-binding protein [Roseomonas sp. E05]|uniref:ABC transporter ATP-binding protein n=1 Tax=Roseomonas sp. E05 TaxID=3046310 RepID=UPI0024BA5188|nr:ABC transporter ATP-binding protein [Roseomonas sp. E05]MDJ0391109.1 ABC transporter ATP-binding protein [Roseomonas sp. E05]